MRFIRFAQNPQQIFAFHFSTLTYVLQHRREKVLQETDALVRPVSLQLTQSAGINKQASVADTDPLQPACCRGQDRAEGVALKNGASLKYNSGKHAIRGRHEAHLHANSPIAHTCAIGSGRVDSGHIRPATPMNFRAGPGPTDGPRVRGDLLRLPQLRRGPSRAYRRSLRRHQQPRRGRLRWCARSRGRYAPWAQTLDWRVPTNSRATPTAIVEPVVPHRQRGSGPVDVQRGGGAEQEPLVRLAV